MNRRDFLTTTVAAAAAASTGPLILGADDKAGSKLPRVGTGEHTYECHHNWGQLPGEYEWQTTHNVAVDAEGLVYITHQGEKGKKGLDTIFVFDPAGKFVRAFGKEWHEGGHGIDIRKEGPEEVLYLCHMSANGPVVKANLKGQVIWSTGRPEADQYTNPKAPFRPTNVAFAPDGSFFVGDGYGSAYLMKYSADGKLLKVFGGAGTENGKFRTPHGNWVDARDPAHPKLVVCDRANARLQTFDLDGKFVSATEPNKVVLFPAHIDIRGDVMLVSDLHTRVTLFGKDNRVIANLGEDEAWRKRVLASNDRKAPPEPSIRTRPSEWPAGKFVHPHDACFDKDGNIYVVEWVAGGRITFLKKVG
jgi:hypothetical protein